MAQEEFWEGTKKGTVTMTVSKEEKELFESIRKIKPAQWKEMKGFMGEAKDIMQQGGLTSFFRAELTTIKDDLFNMFLDPLLEPILAEFAPIISKFMETIIPIIQDLQPFLQGLAETLGKAIDVLQDVSVQLPGGESWDVFWSGTLETFEKLISSMLNFLDGDIIPDEAMEGLPRLIRFLEWLAGRAAAGPSGREERLEDTEWY